MEVERQRSPSLRENKAKLSGAPHLGRFKKPKWKKWENQTESN